VLIQEWENGECYFLDGQSDHFYDCNETVWLGKPLSLMQRQAQKETIDQLLDTEVIKTEDVEAAKDLVVEVDVQARKRIMHQVKQKIQSKLLDEASNLLKLLEKYFLTDIYILYHVVKIPFIKKNYVEVKHWREQYIHIPDNQIRKRKNTNQKNYSHV
jgi:hypothetical protein